MGISLSNKDYIAFTIKKKKKRDTTTTRPLIIIKMIIKEPRKREKKKGDEEEMRNMTRVLLNARILRESIARAKGERRYGRTGCVRGAYAN